MSDKQHWSQFLTHYLPNEFIIRECDKYDSFHQFWTETTRVDCMLRIASIWSDRASLVLVACACARLTLPYIPAGEDRPRLAIEAAEAWTKGEASIQQVGDAADAVTAFANTADNTVWVAARAVAYAATVTDADAAYYTAYYAITAVYYTARAVVGVVSYDQGLEQCINIVRQMLPEPPFQRYYDLRAFS